MLRLETDKGKTYDNCTVANAFDGSVVIRISDDRLLSAIAPEFEGINHMTYTVTESEIPYQKNYDGYSVLSAILRTDIDGKIQISVKKPTGGD